MKHRSEHIVFLQECSSSTGGTLLTVKGFGFGENTTVTVGSESCTVVNASDAELKCRTPAVSVQTINYCLQSQEPALCLVVCLCAALPCTTMEGLQVKQQTPTCVYTG